MNIDFCIIPGIIYSIITISFISCCITMCNDACNNGKSRKKILPTYVIFLKSSIITLLTICVYSIVQ